MDHAGNAVARAKGKTMKPLDVRPQEERRKSPGKQVTRTGKSGEGAASALEQLIHQEKVRKLHKPHETPKDRVSK
jgi:hypothetical protein